MHETGHSKPMHWDNPEEWRGKETMHCIRDKCKYV